MQLKYVHCTFVQSKNKGIVLLGKNLAQTRKHDKHRNYIYRTGVTTRVYVIKVRKFKCEVCSVAESFKYGKNVKLGKILQNIGNKVKYNVS